MKSIFLPSAVLLVTASFAHSQPALLEMNRLRTQFENAVDREVAPLREKYVASLKTLREKYTKSGDLESALLIDKELKAESGTVVESPGKLPGNEGELRGFLLKSRWILMSDPKSRIEFREDGSVSDGKKVIAYYQVTGRRKLTMYWGGGIGKQPLECLISEDCLAIVEQSGYRAVYTLAL